MVLLWAAAIFMEGGSNPIAGLFSGRHVENLQPTQIEEMTEKTEESDEWDLTLFTCTTGGSARCAVRCVRTGYPALTTETAE